MGAIVLFACAGLTSVATAHATGPRSLELAAGQIGKHGWSVFTERRGSRDGLVPHGGQRPCLGVTSYEPFGRFTKVRGSELCYGGPGYLSARAEPLFVWQGISRKTSVVGIALAPAATQMVMLDEHGSKRVIATKRLSASQARLVHMMRFRYATIVFKGDGCVDRWTTLNAQGNALWESEPELCSDPASRSKTHSSSIRGNSRLAPLPFAGISSALTS